MQTTRKNPEKTEEINDVEKIGALASSRGSELFFRHALSSPVTFLSRLRLPPLPFPPAANLKSFPWGRDAQAERPESSV